MDDELLQHRTWALVDDMGYLQDVFEDVSLEHAVDLAEDVACGQVVLDSIYEVAALDLPHSMAANPRRGRGLPVLSPTPAKALRASKLPTVSDDEVMSLSEEEAHALLRPYFPTQKWSKEKKGWTKIKQWQQLKGMRENLLRTNYKIARKHPDRRELVSTGLSLMPNALAFQSMGLAAQPGATRPQGEQSIKGGTLCLSSNEFCRSSCLVYSGQNTADPYNNELKRAQTIALLREPVAFMRMLVAAIEDVKHEREVECNQEACFRLNVFSDVPWELVYPELFERFGDTQFYDYTKVEGREPPPNYDLTFSFSGTNWRACERELDRGLRCAVVFVATRLQEFPLPWQFKGYEVIDGTEHDFRFTDPGGIIVGLRYKSPNTDLLAQSASFMGKALQARNFLVPCWVEDDAVVAAETPGDADGFWYEFEQGESKARKRPPRKR